jgi:hypothetical protein
MEKGVAETVEDGGDGGGRRRRRRTAETAKDRGEESYLNIKIYEKVRLVAEKAKEGGEGEGGRRRRTTDHSFPLNFVWRYGPP